MRNPSQSSQRIEYGKILCIFMVCFSENKPFPMNVYVMYKNDIKNTSMSYYE